MGFGLIGALRKRGCSDDEIEGVAPGVIEHLKAGATSVSWTDYRNLFTRVGESYTDAQLEEFGGSFTGTKAGTKYALVSQLIKDRDEFVRWLRGPMRRLGITCIEQELTVSTPDHLRLETKMKPGYEASREYFIVRCGFLRSIVTGLGGRQATIEVEIDGDCAIYDIRIPSKGHWRRRLVKFLRRSRIDEQDLQNSYEVMQNMREETQERLDELQRAVDSHHQMEERFIKVFAAAPVAMLIAENKEGRIRFVNNSLIEQLGVSREEALGKTATELGIWPTQVERDSVRSKREAGTGQLKSHEVLLKSGTGELRVVLLSTESLILSGEDCTLWNAVDITDRKRVEEELAHYREHLEDLVEERSRALQSSQEQLRQSERLASIGTLAAGIAHEINNPVGLIHLSAEYALSSSADDDRDEVREEALRTCLAEAKRAGEIVRNVLRFSGGGTAERARVDLCEIVKRSEQLVAAYKRGMESKVVVDPGNGPLFVVCSEVELEQVFVNVIRNAIESREGEVTVQVRCGEVGDLARIEVLDNGSGIEPDDLPRLFDPFFSTRQGNGGSGLGLSVAHGIVTAHEGRIWAESEVGKGTRVVIEMPLQR